MTEDEYKIAYALASLFHFTANAKSSKWNDEPGLGAWFEFKSESVAEDFINALGTQRYKTENIGSTAFLNWI